MNDAELRDRLRAWARPIESAPPADIEVIRRRAHRRVRRATVTTVACAAIAVLALAVTVPRLIADVGQQPASGTRDTGWRPAGPLPGPQAGPVSAPFLVILDPRQAGSPAVVYRMSQTQPGPRPIATVRPHGGETWTNVVAAADDRTLVLTGTSFGQSPVTRYYELRLHQEGKPDKLVPLRLSVPGRPLGYLGFVAISPRGTKLAVATQNGRRAAIEVISLVTGAVRTWTAPGQAAQIGSLSWDGSLRLAFLWTAPGHNDPELRVLDTESGDRRLMTSSRLLIPATVTLGRYSGLAYAPITATSSAVFALMRQPTRPAAGTGPRLAVVAFSARTGRPMRVISEAQESGMGSYCGVLWADRSGRQVVTSCGYRMGSTRDGEFTLWSGRSFWYPLKDVPFAW